MVNKMRPIHPGEILREELDELELSASAFAAKLKVPTNRITGILNQKRAVSPDTALRLARFFGTAPEFWLGLQMDYDLKIVMRDAGKQINDEVQTRDAA